MVARTKRNVILATFVAAIAAIADVSWHSMVVLQSLWIRCFTITGGLWPSKLEITAELENKPSYQ